MIMNKKFFIHTITIYHIEDDEATPITYSGVYFRHNKKSNLVDKGLEKGSSGTIYIPTTETLNVDEDDIVVEGSSTTEYTELIKSQTIQKYRVLSVDDNRKGGLQHYKLGVAD